MVAKGLNFDNVTLVGVLDADLSLYVDNYRAAETTFSLLTQVVGRSGRGDAAGIALIQTMTPEHPVMKLAARQDYDGFYEQEIRLRELRGCPPFGDLFTITFTGLFEEQVLRCAALFRDALLARLRAGGFAAQLLGPAPASVARVNYTYRYRLTLDCKNTRELRTLLAAMLAEFARDKRSKGVGAFADVNSYE
jgi:primosomal protein N' (replication factor Y)